MSSSGSGASGSGARDSGRGSYAPLYKRLPHGPHRLDHKEVVRHQRVRIHGAMVEAVAANGYERTSVKQVVGLAGVSRRSFYEQFANKQDCFLATFDLLATRSAKRIRDAYSSTPGGLEPRLQASFARLADTLAEDWKGCRLLILEGPSAGRPGLLRLQRASATFEQLLFSSFAHDTRGGALPRPVVRGMAGGLHGAMSCCLREGSAADVPALAEQMLSWTLRFPSTRAAQLSETLAQRACALGGRTHAGAWPAIATNGNARGRGDAPDARRRMLEQILHLAVTEDYGTLSALQVAEGANVAIEDFFALFDDRDACLLAALDMVGDELLAQAADPALVAGDWAPAVRRVLAGLLTHLAANPLHALAIGAAAPTAGPRAVQRNLDLARDLAALLTEGAPGARRRLAREGVAGAIWHTIRAQAVAGQVHLLPALADYLSYVVLAPFVGAEEAAATVLEELPR